MHFANRLPRVLVRRDENDLDVRMKQQYPQQLRAAVTRTTKYRNTNLVHFLDRDGRLDLRHHQLKQSLTLASRVRRRHIELRGDVIATHARVGNGT